jgi:hypothetical protein
MYNAALGLRLFMRRRRHRASSTLWQMAASATKFRASFVIAYSGRARCCGTPASVVDVLSAASHEYLNSPSVGCWPRHPCLRSFCCLLVRARPHYRLWRMGILSLDLVAGSAWTPTALAAGCVVLLYLRSYSYQVGSDASICIVGSGPLHDRCCSSRTFRRSAAHRGPY